MKIDHYLSTCLRWVRPARTESEMKFADWLVDRIYALGYQPDIDEYGNIWVVQGSQTLFTCHTDTVASKQSKPSRQEIYIDHEGIIALTQAELGRVLGADDGAGIAILLNLLKNQVNADFVFFRDEEIGGLGSAWVARHAPKKFAPYRRAIALDRRGSSDVITHQAGGRCCSDAFAQDLAAELNRHSDLTYEPCDAGIFTDTANLTHLIPECTNLSVGYASEHTCLETLDYNHWQKLLDSLIKIKYDELSTERVPENDAAEHLFCSDSGWFWDDETAFDDGCGWMLEDTDELLNICQKAVQDWQQRIHLFGRHEASELLWTDETLAFLVLYQAVRDRRTPYALGLSETELAQIREMTDAVEHLTPEAFIQEWIQMQPETVATALEVLLR